jgi:sugar O-acyltransferase (sialic acid O-acetyltransferase NeuD family)
MEKTLLIGASGLAREVLALTRAESTHVVFGVLDDGWADMGESFADVPILGPIERAIDYIDTKLLVCVGSGIVRQRIVERLAAVGVGPDNYTTVVDPSVRNPGNSPLGVGSIVLANVVLTADVRVGSHVVVMPNVTLTHDDVIDDYATIAAGVSLGGGVRIGTAAYVGMNAAVRQNISVGESSTLGMSAALLQNLPPGETWVGVPARPHSAAHAVGFLEAQG